MTLEWLKERVTPEAFPHPRCYQQASDILAAVTRIARGQAGSDEYDALTGQAREMQDEALVPEAVDFSRTFLRIMEEQGHVFRHHISSRICPSGDCRPLTPAPCQMACPAGIDIPSYLTLVGLGRYQEALDIIRQDTPFPWICGVACTRPCEDECVRGCLDEPIDIMHLKGIAAEQAEGALPETAPDNGRRVAVVGAGPGGLAAAYFLALRGYQVTVIEASSQAGGLMRSVIPEDRLPQKVLDKDLAAFDRLGIEFRFQTRYGKDLSLQQLRAEGFEALILATGIMGAYQVQIPGEDALEPVLSGSEFVGLTEDQRQQVLGSTAAVIGCGSVGLQAAEACLADGCKRVVILDRRPRSAVGQAADSIARLEKRGAEFLFQSEPVSFTGSRRQLTGLVYRRIEPGQPDEPPERQDEQQIDIDSAIVAMTPALDGTGLTPMEEASQSGRFTVQVDQETMETGEPGIFALGDLVSGLSSIVRCVGGAKKAAASVDRFFSRGYEAPFLSTPMRRDAVAYIETDAGRKVELQRPFPEALDVSKRPELTASDPETWKSSVVQEATRCLRCDICIRCGLCVRICRDDMGVEALHLNYMQAEASEPTRLELASERCIGCGACAVNCPTGAIQIQDRDGERILNLCGTVLCRQPLVYCRSCGAVLGTERYLGYVDQRVDGLPDPLGIQHRCPACAERARAKHQVQLFPAFHLPSPT
jgi:NADPH-dependent glutamate synthase beta subunit-like oxidoreductase/ferredoxin